MNRGSILSTGRKWIRLRTVWTDCGTYPGPRSMVGGGTPPEAKRLGRETNTLLDVVKRLRMSAAIP